MLGCRGANSTKATRCFSSVFCSLRPSGVFVSVYCLSGGSPRGLCVMAGKEGLGGRVISIFFLQFSRRRRRGEWIRGTEARVSTGRSAAPTLKDWDQQRVLFSRSTKPDSGRPLERRFGHSDAARSHCVDLITPRSVLRPEFLRVTPSIGSKWRRMQVSLEYGGGEIRVKLLTSVMR